MSTQPKKKLCWNCEGNVSRQEENCPYCGVYLSPSSLTTEDEEEDLAPPYRLGASSEASSIPSAPYHTPHEAAAVQNEPKPAIAIPSVNSPAKGVVVSLLLLIGGSVFFLFGIALLLFSHNQVLTLQWDGSYWFAYFLISIPMLLLGWKYLMQVDTE